MCGQRVLRSGPPSDVVRSAAAPKGDSRQAAMDLDPPRRNTDPLERAAAKFAEQLTEIRSACSSGEPDEDDAERVNKAIAMVARNADSLISDLVDDAEACGLEASGPWMDTPLVDAQAFEVAQHDPAV